MNIENIIICDVIMLGYDKETSQSFWIKKEYEGFKPTFLDVEQALAVMSDKYVKELVNEATKGEE